MSNWKKNSSSSDPQPPNLGGLEDYILTHIDPEPEYLYRLWRATNIHMLHGRMASGHLQGRLLKMLVQMIRPKNILEVGTFSGYSALCMAEGLDDDGHLYTFEINDEQEDFTRPWIEGAPVADKVSFIIGDAITEAPRLGITFDLAFIDGDKRTYNQVVSSLLTTRYGTAMSSTMPTIATRRPRASRPSTTSLLTTTV